MIAQQDGWVRLIDVLHAAGLCKSKSEARQLIRQGGVTVTWKPDSELAQLQEGMTFALRVGKRKGMRVRIEYAEPEA